MYSVPSLSALIAQVKWSPLVITITSVFSRAHRGKVRRITNARTGNRLFMTGLLGRIRLSCAVMLKIGGLHFGAGSDLVDEGGQLICRHRSIPWNCWLS